MAPYYLKVGRPSDLSNPSERTTYRLLEMLPGAAVWATFIFIIILTALAPAVVAIFTILFDTYWLIKVSYFNIHLSATYREMRRRLATNWFSKLKALPRSAWQANHPTISSWHDIWHLVVLPMVTESEDIARETLTQIAANSYPKDRLIVVLALEERAGKEAQRIGATMTQEFGKKFAHFLVTTHPADIAGEVAGKGSNEAWACREATGSIISPQGIPPAHIVFTSLDIDTKLEHDYFSLLTYMFLTTPKPHNASYQPIAFFTNNVWHAPAIARVISFSGTFWHMIQQERPENQLTFSSHSMSYQTLTAVDFKQTNVVSDDSRIFWQCFFHYNSHYKVVSLYYPVYMDANVAPTFWRTMRNQYLQQQRWAWGANDVAYYLFAFLKKMHHLTARERLHALKRIAEATSGYYSWATASIFIFSLGWLPSLLGGASYHQTILSYSLPGITQALVLITTFGVVTNAFLAIRLLPPRPPEYGRHRYVLMVLQWALLPITINLLGAIPAIDAQTRLLFGRRLGFWVTEKYHHKSRQ